jgi:hypothetical protein
MYNLRLAQVLGTNLIHYQFKFEQISPGFSSIRAVGKILHFVQDSNSGADASYCWLLKTIAY